MNSAGKDQMCSSLNLKVPGQKHRSLFKKTPKGKFTVVYFSFSFPFFLFFCLMFADYEWICISENISSEFFLLAMHLL
jgi:hypothetical protein